MEPSLKTDALATLSWASPVCHVVNKTTSDVFCGLGVVKKWMKCPVPRGAHQALRRQNVFFPQSGNDWSFPTGLCVPTREARGLKSFNYPAAASAVQSRTGALGAAGWRRELSASSSKRAAWLGLHGRSINRKRSRGLCCPRQDGPPLPLGSGTVSPTE